MHKLFNRLDTEKQYDLAALFIHVSLDYLFKDTNIEYECILNSVYSDDIHVDGYDVYLTKDEALLFFDKYLANKLSDVPSFIWSAFYLSYNDYNNSSDDFTLQDLLVNALHYIDNIFIYEDMSEMIDV